MSAAELAIPLENVLLGTSLVPVEMWEVDIKTTSLAELLGVPSYKKNGRDVNCYFTTLTASMDGFNISLIEEVREYVLNEPNFSEENPPKEESYTVIVRKGVEEERYSAEGFLNPLRLLFDQVYKNVRKHQKGQEETDYMLGQED